MRQLKSTAADLRVLFEQSVAARHVAERLRYCRDTDLALQTAKVMEALDFDVMGVETGNVEVGYEMSGYVKRSELTHGLNGDHVHVFHQDQLVEESTSLVDLLSRLRRTSYLFVSDGNAVSGIVTRGDLQKAPVRMLLFGFISLMEMNFLRIIRSRHQDDSWQAVLTKERLDAACKLMNERLRKNEAIDLVDCLQLADEAKIVVAMKGTVEDLGFKSKTKADKVIVGAQDLRNRLAHGNDLVSGSSWDEVLTLSAEIEALLERCEAVS